ncbi:hypothetical protein [Desulfosporosinus sp. I2]|uniref:hypothetical protein n=1 Tax=Desulfosporosinus sp. I2 TaxID=1617025 RepID=UPI0005EFA1E7|nr:hypothetical protein [Desulfosporosinus sp. I2]
MTRDGTAHLGIHRLNTPYLSHIRIRVLFEEIQGDKPLNNEFKQAHEWEPMLITGERSDKETVTLRSGRGDWKSAVFG